MNLSVQQTANALSGVDPTKSILRDFCNKATSNGWSERYGKKHRFRRILNFPAGVRAPQKVRVYERSDHYLLQWWDSAAKRNLAMRVDGDLLDALARARTIDERIANQGNSGITGQRIRHTDLAARFCEDLKRRADAGDIALSTVNRYRAAIQHYVDFQTAGDIGHTAYANQANREFAQDFAAFLTQRQVCGNGRAGAQRRTMRSSHFVLDAVRAMYEWAIDPDGGKLLPQDFRNPFRRALGSRRPAADMTAAPDITATMAANFLAAADDFQLPLFCALLFFGLRAAEPCMLLFEDIKDCWLHVDCKPELDFETKGHRNKRFPLVETVGELISKHAKQRRGGMLFLRRDVAGGRTNVAIADVNHETLVGEYRRRLGNGGADSRKRAEVRDTLFRDCGALNYDAIETEFKTVARRLNWPKTATLKDLRHLFCTAMSNSGMPEGYRRFLMGHAPGREAIVAYTHLNKLTEFYTRAIETELAEPLNVLRNRLQNSEVRV